MKIGPDTVIVEISGGNLQAVYTDGGQSIVVVDWDNIEAAGVDEAGLYPTNRLAEMPETTLNAVEHALAGRKK